MSAIRFTVVLIAFCLGLGGGLWTFKRLAAQSPTSSGGAIEHLKKYGDSYDVIIMGSSFVRINFVPPAFDKRMKKHGYAIHSFNFALSGLMGSELDYYIEQILDLDLPRLKWIFLDVTLNQYPRLKEGNYYKLRVIRWHTWTRYLQVQQAIMQKETSLSERLEEVWVHAQHLLLNLGNVGEGMYALRNGTFWGERPEIKKRFHFHVGPFIRKRQRKRALIYRMTRRGRHEGSKRELARKRRDHQLKPRDLRLAFRWRDMIESRGYRALFVVGPALEDASIRSDRPHAKPLNVIDLSDPDAFPSLYRIEGRYDRGHMTYDGAVRYTRVLADEFVTRFGEELR